MLAGWGVPFVCTETHELGEEIVASYLYQVHLSTTGSSRTDTENGWRTMICNSGYFQFDLFGRNRFLRSTMELNPRVTLLHPQAILGDTKMLGFGKLLIRKVSRERGVLTRHKFFSLQGTRSL